MVGLSTDVLQPWLPTTRESYHCSVKTYAFHSFLISLHRSLTVTVWMQTDNVMKHVVNKERNKINCVSDMHVTRWLNIKNKYLQNKIK